MHSRTFLALLLLPFSALLASCENYQGPVINPAGSQCTGGEAQIGVGDGFLQFLCGCTGGSPTGTTLPAPANLTCHVPSGTTVFFQYIAIQDQHQIINSSGNFFPSGPIINPPAVGQVSDATFTATGTYGFQDAFNNALQGSIIVP